MKRIFELLFCALIISGCSENKVKISGTIDNAENAVLYFEEVDVYNTIPVDSIKLGQKGRFRFKTDLAMAGFYQLRIGADKVIVLFPEPGNDINIHADAKKLPGSVKVRGSHHTEQITKLIVLLAEARTKLDSLQKVYEKAGDDSLRAKLNNEYQNILESHRKASITYILTNYNSLSGVYAIYQQYQPGFYLFYKTTDLQFFKILSDSLSKYHPNSKHVKALKTYTDKRLREYNAQVLLSKAEVVEGRLPEIELPDYTGANHKLSSLKGKYVLLSFWVSGNEACVRQNLELKRVYNDYRKKGFEIYQVSFDNSTEQWQRALRFDEIPWISVIDTGYSVVAGNYNVTRLPANYLIGKDNNTILGKNLTPTQVRDKLQDIFN